MLSHLTDAKTRIDARVFETLFGTMLATICFENAAKVAPPSRRRYPARNSFL